MNSTANFVFDDDFSLELEHYCKELEFLAQTLQLAIDLSGNFEKKLQQQQELHNKEDQSQISLSAFSKASHRLRSMALVSGYLLSQKGKL